MTFNEGMGRFLAHLTELAYKNSTISAYKYELYRFKFYLEQHNLNTEPAFITSTMILDFFDFLKTQYEYQDTSLARVYTALKKFFTYLHNEGYILKNPFNSIRFALERQYTKEPLAVSSDILQKIMDQDFEEFPAPLRDKAIVCLLAETGMKPQELVFLKRTDFLREQNKIHIPPVGKGKERTLPIVKASFALEAYLASRTDYAPWLIVGTKEKPISIDTVQRIVKLTGEKFDLHLTPQLLRHLFAKDFLRKHQDLAKLQYALGVRTLKVNAFPMVQNIDYQIGITRD